MMDGHRDVKWGNMDSSGQTEGTEQQRDGVCGWRERNKSGGQRRSKQELRQSPVQHARIEKCL